MFAKKTIALTGAFLLTACLFVAQATRLDGTWEGKMDREGQIETLTFQFHAKDNGFTGKVFRNGEEFGDIANAKVDGNKFSFKADVVSFDGTLEGDQLKVTVTVMNGNKFYCTASRKKAAG